MRPAKRLRLRFSSLQLLLLLLWAAPRPCAAGDEEDDDDDDDAGLPGHKDHHWSYKDMPEWASMFPNCDGHMQSPININTAAVSFSVKLEPLLLSGYDLPPEETLPLKNNGHTVGVEPLMGTFEPGPEGLQLFGYETEKVLQRSQRQAVCTNQCPLRERVSFPGLKDRKLHLNTSTIPRNPGVAQAIQGAEVCTNKEPVNSWIYFFTVLLGLPKKMTLSGGGFPQPYQAAQLHLHWGSGHTWPGSEHTVDGHRYAGEIHVVHYSSCFESFEEAASEPGGLAVLAAFLQVGMETNEPYQHILKHLSDIKEEGEETAVAGFDVAKLLPYDFDRYFRYNGSLTTPPCYQTVNWTVFNQTVRLSQEQISMLEETLQGDDDEPIQSNFRLLQDLYGRSILSSFHTLEKVHPPGGGPSEEGGDQAEPKAGGVLSSPLPDGAPRDGLDPTSGKDAEKRVGISLHTGDILAILFGSLFAATALAFLFFVHKHRRQASREQATKPAALYTLASTDEHAL